RAARHLSGVADAPPMALEDAPILDIALREQERELERLVRFLWKRHMLQETDALVVVAADFLPVFDHLDPLARPPSGDSGERLAARVVNIRPEVQAHRRMDVNPLQPAVAKPCCTRPDGLADGEIDIVRGNPHLSATDP